MAEGPLTARDREILQTLTHGVRVLTLGQIARTFWVGSNGGVATARARIEILRADGLVLVERAPAHPELPLEEPVIRWQPSEADPDYAAASYRLQSRWTGHPVMTTCISASRKAANRFGGHGGRLPREIERSHDIHLARVYLLYRLRSPELALGWIFEERLRGERKQRRERLPDALLRNGASEKIIEFGGAYPKEKLRAFHRYCSDRELPYEVW